MRDEIIAYLKTKSAVLKTVGVSEELPYNKDGEPLYLKNYKKVYVADDVTEQESLFNTLQGASIAKETTTVVAYLVLDSKTKIANYTAIVDLMKGIPAQVSPQERMERRVSVAKSYEADAEVIEFTYNFTQVKFN